MLFTILLFHLNRASTFELAYKNIYRINNIKKPLFSILSMLSITVLSIKIQLYFNGCVLFIGTTHVHFTEIQVFQSCLSLNINNGTKLRC